jgi:hypothetical protein
VRSAIAQATRSVFILGWNFDSRTQLVPHGANDGYPEANATSPSSRTGRSASDGSLRICAIACWGSIE